MHESNKTYTIPGEHSIPRCGYKHVDCPSPHSMTLIPKKAGARRINTRLRYIRSSRHTTTANISIFSPLCLLESTLKSRAPQSTATKARRRKTDATKKNSIRPGYRKCPCIARSLFARRPCSRSQIPQSTCPTWTQRKHLCPPCWRTRNNGRTAQHQSNTRGGSVMNCGGESNKSVKRQQVTPFAATGKIDRRAGCR